MQSNPSSAGLGSTIIRIKGRDTAVPSATINGRLVIVTGNFLKTAKLHDEELVEGDPVHDPSAFVGTLKRTSLKADLFTFLQKPSKATPKNDFPMRWENWAVIRTGSFKEWWENMLPQESRKNVRRAAKRGVVVRTVPFTDELVAGISSIYNETPVRQGRAFWHFGKDLETVKKENITYLERSEFFGAFLDQELIGFIKVIYTDQVAVMIQILAKNAHHDKRPMNALLAHTVEVCEKRGIEFLTYGQYVYGNKQNSSLTEFKRRNGFEEIKFPRYYVPLTVTGNLAIRTGLHQGIKNAIPAPVTELLLKLRARAYRSMSGSRQPAPQEG